MAEWLKRWDLDLVVHVITHYAAEIVHPHVTPLHTILHIRRWKHLTLELHRGEIFSSGHVGDASLTH